MNVNIVSKKQAADDEVSWRGGINEM